jgi:hypothetical protein
VVVVVHTCSSHLTHNSSSSSSSRAHGSSSTRCRPAASGTLQWLPHTAGGERVVQALAALRKVRAAEVPAAHEQQLPLLRYRSKGS